jgi:hypothetical protein
MKSSDKIKNKPIHEQIEILNNLLFTHGEVECLNCNEGEYYKADKWDDEGVTTHICCCYDCLDTIWIDVNNKGTVVGFGNSEVEE